MQANRQKLETAQRDLPFTLAVSGILLLTSSHGAYFATGGNIARYAMLLAGFGCTVAGASLRARCLVGLDYVLAVVAGFVAGLLTLQSWLLQQELFSFPSPVFHLICLALLGAGYVLAKGRRPSPDWPSGWRLMPAALVSIICILLMWRFLGSSAVSASERSYGDSELNPISVAYYNSLVFVAYAILFLCCRRLLPRVVFGIGAALAIFLVVTSGSRGAVIWLALTGLVLAPTLARRAFASVRQVVLLGASLVLVGIVGYVLAKGGGEAMARVEVLRQRVETLYYAVTEGEQDLSASSREQLWSFYTEHPEVAWPLGEKGYIGYPHNQFIEFYARFGLLGILFSGASLWLLVQSIRHLWQSRRDPDPEFLVIGATFLFAYMQSMTSMSLEMNRILWLGFGYILGLHMARSESVAPPRHASGDHGRSSTPIGQRLQSIKAARTHI